MGTGGSRYGAGRSGWRRKCEHLLGLDIRVLSRRGHIPVERHISRYFSWRWTRADEPAGSIYIQADHDRARLIYSANSQPLDYSVSIERTPCRYGGTRLWFRCPRCHARRAVLYGTASDGRFGCRCCMRLAYASEAESKVDRINRKSHRLEAQLGDNGEKPKWMRWRTFDQICAQLEAADQAWGAQVFARFGALARYIEDD